MKKQLSATIAAATLLTAGMAAPAMAEVSANAGFVSDYYFRGGNLGNAGAYGGIDYEQSGFYAGVWAIDDGASDKDGNHGNDGLEVDYYFGYGMEHGDFGWSLGMTHYDYTYTSNYEREVNVNLAYQAFGFEYSTGTAVEDPDGADNEADYTYIALSWGGEVFAATLGNKQSDEDNDDSEYSHLDLSASGEVAGLDMGLTLGRKFNSKDAAGDDADNGRAYLFLDISKSFSL